MELQWSLQELVLNTRWVQDFNRGNVPCLRSMSDISLPNTPSTEVFIKMMLFDPEVGQSIKGGNVAGRHGVGREINEYYSETKKKRSWGMLPGDQKKVTSTQRLKHPMK
jgi:hypothetical protein